MLQSIRDKTSGWIAYLIIGLISIPFALWGINSYLGGGEQKPAAIVDGVEITPAQLDRAYARYRERLAAVFGGQLPEAFADDVVMKEQVLGQLIEEQVLLGYIKDQGFRVGDEKLFENIQGMSVFLQDGKFSKELYRNQLASQGYLPTQFEEEFRRSQEMQQLSQAIKSSAFLLPVLQEQYNQLNNQQRKLRVISIENKTDSIEVTNDEVAEYYNSQPGLFMNPEQVRVDYIEVNIDILKDTISVSEDQLKERYEHQREQLTTPETREASHILLTVKTDDDEAQQEQVKQKIEDLKSRIDKGENFADLAREFSQDPGSAADGGSLGEVEKGMMVKPFETTLFSMNEGDISEPVKTQFGWHLIKLHKISGGQTQAYEQVREQLKQEISAEVAETQIYDLAESLSNISYEQPDSLLPASEQLGLKIQTSDWFTRSSGQGVAATDKVRQAAFTEDVLKQNRNSEAIELGDNRVVVIHLNSHKEAERQPLEQVFGNILRDLKTRKGRELAQHKGKALLDELVKGETTLDTVASDNQLKIVDIGLVDRKSTALGSDLINTAFTMAHPVNASPVYEGVSEVNGNYSIVELSDIQVAQISDSEQTSKAINNLIQAASESEYRAMLKLLTAKSDILRNPVAELQ